MKASDFYSVSDWVSFDKDGIMRFDWSDKNWITLHQKWRSRFDRWNLAPLSQRLSEYDASRAEFKRKYGE